MYRDTNSPAEMGRRLAYLFYVVVFITYMFSCVIALAKPGVGEIVAACGSLLLLIGIRYAGYRWLDFKRLAESFPAGCAMDRVPIKIRTEVESLVYEFHAPGTEWMRRQAIRRRLVQLEDEEPEIILAYEEELKDVLAA